MINKKIKSVLKITTMAMAFVGVSAFAGAAEDLQTRLLTLDSIDTKFSQVVVDELGNEIDSSSGSFQLQRPMKFRWNVALPYEQEIVSDGMSLWQFDKDIEQINVSTLSDSFANSPAAILSQSDLDMAKDYNITSLKGEDASDYIYHLTPVSEDALFEVMVMQFDEHGLVAFHVKDSLGQTTLVEFSEQKFKQNFADDFFTFKIPENVDLIDSRNEVVIEEDILTRPPVIETKTIDTEAIMDSKSDESAKPIMDAQAFVQLQKAVFQINETETTAKRPCISNYEFSG